MYNRWAWAANHFDEGGCSSITPSGVHTTIQISAASADTNETTHSYLQREATLRTQVTNPFYNVNSERNIYI